MSMTTGWTRKRIWIVFVLVVFGVGLRVAWVDRPLDHRIVNPWRQADYFQIARNFFREGGDIMHPQIDWRGDTAGYAEMELPIVPWVAALLFDLFGMRAPVFRALTAAVSVFNFGLFMLLAFRLLRPPASAVAAIAFFAVNPVLVILAGSMQPETLMHGLLLLTALLTWKWLRDGKWWLLILAGMALGFAIMVKLPAAHFGLVIAYVVFRRIGLANLVRAPVVPLAAALALVPPALWYSWAHRFWTTYGLSLGVSNESHWIGLDLLWPPLFVFAIVAWETAVAVTPAGWLLAFAAWRGRGRPVEFVTAWYIAAVVFYLLAARTTTDQWAFYYHILSIAPMALLMGAGFERLQSGAGLPTRWNVRSEWQRIAGMLCVAATMLAFIVGNALLVYKRDNTTQREREMYLCSVELAEVVPKDGKIVVRGGRMFDQSGRPVAYNESMVFAWMDRKGFNYAVEEFNLETLDAIARRGGRYWFVADQEIKQAGLDEDVRARYQVVGECRGSFSVFDLFNRREPNLALP
jgi:4-amino-4-deoxy-L-arabinose transferase-like glycosyltransferase